MFSLRSRTFLASLALGALGLLAAPLSAQTMPPPPYQSGAFAPGTNPLMPYGSGGGSFTVPIPTAPGTSMTTPVPTPAMTPGYYPSYGYGGYYDIYPYAGLAQLINAQGQYWMSEEKARSLREDALQKFLETRKKAIMLQRWIDETTPTFTMEQNKWRKEILKRIRDNATPSEIWSGRALNVLNKDLIGFLGFKKKIDFEPLKLDESVLRHLNVSVPNGGNLGLLRNGGRFVWPLALQELATDQERDDIDRNVQELISQAAANGKMNKSTQKLIQDLDRSLRTIRDTLNKKILPARQFLQASRFLDDFQSGIYALENPAMAQKYFEYQNWVKDSKDGRTVPEVVAWMASRGLSFAPAAYGDEFAYEAMYAAMANYDVAFQVAANTKGANKDR